MSDQSSYQPLCITLLDGDGNIDVMFPVCWPVGTCAEENSIRIIYNQQRTICTSIFGGSDCRKDTDLCSGDDSFTFEPFNANSGKVQYHTPPSRYVFKTALNY
jgi:hypothetical protein